MRSMITTDQVLPDSYLYKLKGTSAFWERAMYTRGNIFDITTRAMGKVKISWFPNKRRNEQITITCTVSVQWGHTDENNWLALLHGLTGLGYARVTAVFITQRMVTITATKDNGMRQFALPYDD